MERGIPGGCYRRPSAESQANGVNLPRTISSTCAQVYVLQTLFEGNNDAKHEGVRDLGLRIVN